MHWWLTFLQTPTTGLLLEGNCKMGSRVSSQQILKTWLWIQPQWTALGNQRRFVSRRINQCLRSHPSVKLPPLGANCETDPFPDWCWSSSKMHTHRVTFDINFSCPYLTHESIFWQIVFLNKNIECIFAYLRKYICANMLLVESSSFGTKSRGWL